MAAPPTVDLRQLNAAQTVWPVVGGSGLITHTAAYFESHAYQQVYKKGKKREIYIAGCSGLRDLSKQLKMPIFKVEEYEAGHKTMINSCLIKDMLNTLQPPLNCKTHRTKTALFKRQPEVL